MELYKQGIYISTPPLDKFRTLPCCVVEEFMWGLLVAKAHEQPVATAYKFRHSLQPFFLTSL